MPYARLKSCQMAGSVSPPVPRELVVSRLLLEGTVVNVPKPGTQRSYVMALNGSLRALVDNAELEWLPEPARPSVWELLGGPGWVVG